MSLIFLLYENVDVALQYILQIESGVSKLVLVEWAAQGNPYWPNKFIEAVSIIQNFRVLKKLGRCNKLARSCIKLSVLGLEKEKINIHYLPHNRNVSLFVEKIRKYLYWICEDYDQSETTNFILLVNQDMATKGFPVGSFQSRYLEAYFLQWFSIRYISKYNFDNIVALFKSIEKQSICDALIKLAEVQVQECSVSFAQDRVRKSSSAAQYPIGDNPGICLIINQKHFYTEFDECFQVGTFLFKTLHCASMMVLSLALVAKA